jgi:hypothetical protein
MVPINTLVKLERVYGPETASRYNLFNSIGINAIQNRAIVQVMRSALWKKSPNSIYPPDLRMNFRV